MWIEKELISGGAEMLEAVVFVVGVWLALCSLLVLLLYFFWKRR